MARSHLADALNITAFILLAAGLWLTLFGPKQGETIWQAVARLVRPPRPTPLITTKEQLRFQLLPRHEQANYARQTAMLATLTPANQGHVAEATKTVMNEIRIGATNAKWGASLLVLGAACTLIATLL